jgi:hypothetical protein
VVGVYDQWWHISLGNISIQKLEDEYRRELDDKGGSEEWHD